MIRHHVRLNPPWKVKAKKRKKAKPKQSATAKQLEHGLKVVLKAMQSQ